MSQSWIVYLVVSALTRSPLLGLLAIAILWYSGSAWWVGRLWNPLAPLKEHFRIRDLRRELGVNPHNLNVRAELGALLATRRPAEAKELLEEVVRRAPELPLPHVHLGQALLALGDTAGGAAAIEAGLRTRPDVKYGEPLVRLGDHHLAKGDAAAAAVAFERATRVHTSYAEAWYKAGVAAAAQGDHATARAHWQEALASTEHAPAFKRRIDRSWRWRSWWALRRQRAA